MIPHFWTKVIPYEKKRTKRKKDCVTLQLGVSYYVNLKRNNSRRLEKNLF